MIRFMHDLSLAALLDKAETAKLLRISPRTLDAYMRQRRIPFYKLGRGRNAVVRFKLADLETILDAYRVDAV
ncbi:MAG: helix-turn-helix domain-containing protein [Chthoniobacterales bacterium]